MNCRCGGSCLCHVLAQLGGVPCPRDCPNFGNHFDGCHACDPECDPKRRIGAADLERCDREIARIQQETFEAPTYLFLMGLSDWQLERKVIAGERSELNVGGNLVRCG